MKNSLARAAAATVAILALTGGAIAGQDKGVTANDGWVRLPAPGDTQAMAFVTVLNPTMYAIYLTGATADVAGTVELRDRGQSGDSREKAVEFITVPAYDRVDMGPGGVYLLLRDLKRPLQEGDTVALTLSTDVAVTLKIAAIVKKG
jgi:periplasmic copper chaperone A